MQKHQIRRLVRLCSLAYFVSYVTRINLSAVLVEVTASGYASMRTAALALTLCSVTYGAGQVLSGWLGDRFKPQHLMLGGFLLTSAMNLAVAALPSGDCLPLLWAVNGLAQSLMWPPLVVILSGCLNEKEYQKAIVRVSWGSSFGTIAVYLLCPVLLRLTGLRSVFLTSALAALAMALHWVRGFHFYATHMVDGAKITNQQTDQKKRMDRMGLMLISAILVAIILQGTLRDGVSNWMPTYMSETFRLSSSISILTGVILPLFSLFCYHLASIVHRRWISNELACASIVFGIGCLAALVLALTNSASMAASLLSLALLVGSMHGVNLLLICYVPRHFSRYGQTGLISGVLNSGTYIGSAISGYGTALFAEIFGWQGTIVLWALIALSGAAICFALIPKWRTFKTAVPK